MKALALLVVLIFVGLLSFACGESTEVEVPEDTSILLVQDADSGSLVDNKDGTYTLELAGVPSFVFYDGPGTYATNKISMGDFAAIWDEDGGNEFDGDPPNAALEILNADPSQDVVTLEIADASYDAQTDTLNCIVRLLESAGGELAVFDSRSVGLTGTPDTFEDVALFVELVGAARSGDIYGSISFADGRRAPGVLVTLHGFKLGRLSTISMSNGVFRFLAIPWGDYEIFFEEQGYKTVRRVVELEPGRSINLDIVLEVDPTWPYW